MIAAREFFTASEEDKRKFKLATEKQKCSECKGNGVCAYCEGDGKVNHECDCIYCGHSSMEECSSCDGNGHCRYCDGKGMRLLDEADLQQAGFSKDEARQAVAMRR